MTDKLDTAAIRAQMEALAGFTPGPWDTETDLPYNTMPRVSGADGSLICECGNVSTDQDQWESDARLIAAAPDMRATIIALCDEVERLRTALAFYTVSDNWRIGGPLDGNSPSYTGGPARAALAQEGGE